MSSNAATDSRVSIAVELAALRTRAAALDFSVCEALDRLGVDVDFTIDIHIV